MPYNPNIVSNNIRELEYNKFTQIYNDSRFPPVTAVIQSYDDNTTQTNVYNKEAILAYVVNTSEITLSAGNLNIGVVQISDPNDTSIKASVISTGVNKGAMSVYTANTVAVSGSVGQANSKNWSVTQVEVTTAAYTAFPSVVGNVVTVSNTTGDTLLLTKGGAGFALPILSNSTIDINVVANANEIQLKATTSLAALTAFAIVTQY